MTTETRFADLHLHSTASDGSERPSEVVRRAVAHGFSAMALADHDTMDGVPEAAAAAAQAGIDFITGVEYSTLDGEREIHMLGYGVDADDAALQKSLAILRAGRFDRGQGMVEKLNELGLVISWARVQE